MPRIQIRRKKEQFSDGFLKKLIEALPQIVVSALYVSGGKPKIENVRILVEEQSQFDRNLPPVDIVVHESAHEERLFNKEQRQQQILAEVEKLVPAGVEVTVGIVFGERVFGKGVGTLNLS